MTKNIYEYLTRFSNVFIILLANGRRAVARKSWNYILRLSLHIRENIMDEKEFNV